MVPVVSTSAVNMIITDSSETSCESVLTRIETACRSSGPTVLENVSMAGAGVNFLYQPTAACSGNITTVPSCIVPTYNVIELAWLLY